MTVSAADEIRTTPDPYVSRAAYKLLGALDDLAIGVCTRALDAGASTGGFTQVLLERGWNRVYAVDVGHGQLHQSLREDARVRVREGLNLRDLTLADVDGQPVDLVVGDVSFISMTLLIPPLTEVVSSAGSMLLLVKPQFEVGRGRLGKNGVVRDPDLHEHALASVAAAAGEAGWTVRGRAASRLDGESGNREFFLHLVR